jgi:hypothetical protein
MIVLRLNSGTHGYNEEISNVEDLQEAIKKELDDDVVEVFIQKKTTEKKSKGDFATTCHGSTTNEKRELNILGVIYTVEEVEVVNKTEPRRGEINFLTNEIKIDKNMPTSLKEQVLMHEVLHATFDLLGFSELAENEEKVQSIATALHQIITSQTIFSF